MMQEEKANLARVRENQRRSRARRKDYLQELENKLRQCELQGVEASSEIQLAARRVADENKRLRDLLTRNGITDDDIDDYTPPESATHGMYGQGGQDGQDILEGEAVQELEGLLVKRKCCPSGTSAPSIQRHDMLREGRDYRIAPPVQIPRNQFTYGVYSASITSTSPSSVGCSPQAYDLPPPPLQQTHFLPGSNISLSSSSFTSEHDSDAQLPYHGPVLADTGNGTAQYNNLVAANSCIYATDLITTMAGGDPLTVREELGCGPGMDCEVDNTLVFTVLDRYTDSGASGV